MPPVKYHVIFFLMLIPIVLCVCIIQARASDWSMFQKDPQHTGFSDSSSPNSAEIRFIVNYTSRHNTYSSPILMGDRLIIAGGGYEQSTYSINATSGELLWVSPQYVPSYAVPAVFEDRIVIPSADGLLSCINVFDGTLIWQFRVSVGGTLQPPILHDGIVYVSSGTTSIIGKRGSVFALSLFEMENETAPKLVWERSLDSIATSSPAYSKGRILIGYTVRIDLQHSEENYVACLNSTDGFQIWNKTLETGSLPSTPTIYDGKVCFGSDRKVYCLSETSGELLWMTPLSSVSIYASPAIADGKLYIGTLTHRAPDIPGIFACLNMSSGDVIWEYQMSMDESPASSPAIADGKVFVCSGRSVYAFNASTGEIIWLYETLGLSGGCSPAVGLDSVYVLDQNGYVYSFGTPQFCHLIISSEHGNPTGEGFYPVGSEVSILVNSTIAAADGIRYVFTGWTGDFTSEDAAVNIEMNYYRHTIVANWKKQYYLTVDSAFGNPEGEGWYDVNETASFSVSSPAGFIIQNRFRHWVDDSTSSSLESTILMNGPKKVTAEWEVDYSQFLIILVITCAGSTSMMVVFWRKYRTARASSLRSKLL